MPPLEELNRLNSEIETQRAALVFTRTEKRPKGVKTDTIFPKIVLFVFKG